MQKKSELSYNGIPFRGTSVPLVKDDDPNSRKPQLKYESHAAAFRLDVPEQKKELDELLTAIDNTRFELKQLERVYDSAIKTFCVFIHWSEPYYEFSPADSEHP